MTIRILKKHSYELQIFRHTATNLFGYSQLDCIQHSIAERVRTGGMGAILLSEVAPVITVGRRTPVTDLPFSEEILNSWGVDRVQVDRGGLATWHGPGQWVCFVVDSLERLTGDRRGVRLAVNGLLESVQQAVRPWAPAAEIRSGHELGVWGSNRKISALGVHIDRGVLLHGVAVNVFQTALSFQGLRPCGLDLPVGFLLSAETSDQEKESAFQQLAVNLVEELEDRFW